MNVGILQGIPSILGLGPYPPQGYGILSSSIEVLPLGLRIITGIIFLLVAFWPIYVIHCKQNKKSLKEDKSMLVIFYPISASLTALAMMAVFNYSF